VGVLLGEPYTVLLADIASFLATHRFEVLHLILGNFGGAREGGPERQLLLDQIEAALGPLMIPRTADLHLRATFGELVAADQRVLVIYPAEVDIVNRPLFWPEDPTTEGRYAGTHEHAFTQGAPAR
jgi:hypothetical protein